ncbi:GntR family transcriptional regulator [Agrilactobacillus yilanensis]|uniref:GntR family transcriptional regulator n=1 Tax=Agrilactobacillus yilanensis TaxID=2485997 RepID=A0ABW4J6M4_9LACO|nr:GntR family transcriptional regulator [Agrilactobacillus yilanensis]
MKKNLYQIIVDDLSRDIHNGTLLPNTKIPTEQALAKQYQVSRITSKRALNDLETAGLIYRKQGSGSFVQPDQITTTASSAAIAASPAKNDILLIVIPTNNVSEHDALATALNLALQQTASTTICKLVLADKLLATITELKTDTLSVLLLGDHFDHDMIYQLYELNIFFFQVATIPDPLERPQLLLSTTTAIQDLLDNLPQTATQLYYCGLTSENNYSDQALKIDLLKLTRQHPEFKLHLLDTLTDLELNSELNNVLIFRDFYTLLTYRLQQSVVPSPPTYLVATTLTSAQQSLLKTFNFSTYAIDTDYLLKVILQSLTTFKKSATMVNNPIISAKKLTD